MDEMCNRHFKALGELELSSVVSVTFPAHHCPVYQDGAWREGSIAHDSARAWHSPGSEPGKKD